MYIGYFVVVLAQLERISRLYMVETWPIWGWKRIAFRLNYIISSILLFVLIAVSIPFDVQMNNDQAAEWSSSIVGLTLLIALLYIVWIDVNDLILNFLLLRLFFRREDGSSSGGQQQGNMVGFKREESARIGRMLQTLFLVIFISDTICVFILALSLLNIIPNNDECATLVSSISSIRASISLFMLRIIKEAKDQAIQRAQFRQEDAELDGLFSKTSGHHQERGGGGGGGEVMQVYSSVPFVQSFSYNMPSANTELSFMPTTKEIN